MFFIGGFNTAVPYLIYLAFIWIFMIIGVSGMHKNLSGSKLIHLHTGQFVERNGPSGPGSETTHYDHPGQTAAASSEINIIQHHSIAGDVPDHYLNTRQKGHFCRLKLRGPPVIS